MGKSVYASLQGAGAGLGRMSGRLLSSRSYRALERFLWTQKSLTGSIKSVRALFISRTGRYVVALWSGLSMLLMILNAG